MPRLDKQDWVRAAFALAAGSGIAAVKVEPLAKTLGVTKGSFYHHFDDRPALLAVVLAHWVEQDTERVIELVESSPAAGGRDALHRLIDLTFGPPNEFDGVETAIREWAVNDAAVAATVAEVDERRLSYVAGLLADEGVAREVARGRAHVVYRLVIGEYLWRRYGGDPIDTGAVHSLVDWAVGP